MIVASGVGQNICEEIALLKYMFHPSQNACLEICQFRAVTLNQDDAARWGALTSFQVCCEVPRNGSTIEWAYVIHKTNPEI